MVEDTKKLFREILSAFLNKYQFALPDILEKAPAAAPAPNPAPELVAAE